MQIQRQKIQSDFKNLQCFLHEEEKSYLWRLEKEEQQTLSRLRDYEVGLGLKSNELKSHIQELEEKCQGSAQKLLQVRLFIWSREKRYVIVLLKENDNEAWEDRVMFLLDIHQCHQASLH